MAENAKNRRLDSWKEIATYLARDVRTVIRWEKRRGLPIHRVPGGGRNAVFAFPGEIDKWILGSSAKEADGPETHGHIPEAPVHPLHVQRIRFLSIAIPAVLLLTIAIVGVVRVRMANAFAGIAKVSWHDKKFEAIDKKGRVAWTYGVAQVREETPPGREPGIYYAGDLMADGHTEVLVSLPYPKPNSKSGELDEQQLFCFSESGKLLWQFDPEETMTFGEDAYGPPWHIRYWMLNRAEGQTRISVVVTHDIWFPSMLITLDAHGGEASRYVNSGDILSMSTMEGPNGPLMLAGGVTSGVGPNGFFAVLDGNNPSGTSPEAAGSKYVCKSCPPGKPIKYFVFPRSEINVITLSHFNQVYSIRPAQSGIEIETSEVDGGPVGVAGIYDFTKDFVLTRATWSDGYVEMHRKLERDGTIHHTWEQCPDRFGPRVVRVWNPEHGWTELHPNKPLK